MSTTAGSPSTDRSDVPVDTTNPFSSVRDNRVPESERLVSLDVFRGLTIAGMILVTDPGTYSAVYWPLLHAAWNGWTPTDMIFPSFLFIVGVAMTLSFDTRAKRGETRGRLAGHVAWRTVILIVLGLILNGFPKFNLQTLRIPGILQRIALCYLCGGLLYLFSSREVSRGEPGYRLGPTMTARVSVIMATTVTILAGYWAILKLVPVPGFGAGRLDSLGNPGAYFDRAIFGVQHLWAYGLTPGYGVTYDPEGLLSTIPAIATLLIGILTGVWLRGARSAGRKAMAMLAVGVVLLLAGRLLNPLMPINKRLWTPTFTLFSGGFSLIALALCYWMVDIRRWRWWTAPALVFGTNAIFAFALANIITPLLDMICVRASTEPITLHAWGYSHLFLSWLSPIHASLAYAIAIVLLNLAIVSVLYRKRIFLRI
jgi:predicted acyltransferase